MASDIARFFLFSMTQSEIPDWRNNIMKHTKTAAALALAGIAASPLAQAAEGTTVTLSGQVAIGILASDAEDIDAINEGDPIGVDANGDTIFATAADVVSAARPGDPTVFGDDSTINVKATGTLNNGLEGYANYRTDLGLVGDVATGDNIHLGIKGDFGDIRVGEVPDATGYGQQYDMISGSDIDGENFGISYTGTFGGLTFGVNASPSGSSDRYAAGVKFSAAGFGIGIGAGSDDDRSEFSVGATYSIGGVSLGANFKDLDNDRAFVGAGASFGVNDFNVGVTYEAEAGDVNDGDFQLRFDVGYDLGNGMNISARVNSFTDDSDSSGDLLDYRLLLTKAF